MKNSSFIFKILQVLFEKVYSNKLIKSIHQIIQNINFNLIRKFETQVVIRLDDYKRKRLLSKNTVETNFINYIKNSISNPKIILELGSRDGIQSIEFARLFPNAKIYAFECHPPNIKRCIRNTKHMKNIEIVPKAVFNKNGTIKFYSSISRNTGVGSLYRASRKYDVIEKIPQKEIIVNSTRIDTWANKKNVKKIDLCWIDLQGAEYETLESMGNMIFDIDALFIEVELQEIYNGVKLYDDILNLMEDKGFSMIKFHEGIEKWFGNAIFLNNNLIK